MKLEKFLTKKRNHIVDKWIQCVEETYPSETVEFFRHQKNRFANPIGAAISETMGPLFDEILNENDSEKISALLDRIIRIRAVQDFLPSGAIAVVFLLKKVIRDELKKGTEKEGLIEVKDLLEFESRIDYCVLLAFDVYMKCRETIWANKLDDFIKRPFVTGGNMRCLSYMLRQEQKQSQGTKDCCSNCSLGEVR
jgi:hypothetical protein